MFSHLQMLFLHEMKQGDPLGCVSISASQGAKGLQKFTDTAEHKTVLSLWSLGYHHFLNTTEFTHTMKIRSQKQQ